MFRRLTNKQAVAATALIALIVGALAATAVAQSQRFPDVPPDHEAYEAVEWAAEVGLTVGREDGTFGPNEALPKWRALIFMERFYDDVLGADESGAFTSGDMMMLLKAINDGSTRESGSRESGGDTPTSTLPPSDDEVEAIHSYDRIQNLAPPGGTLDAPFGATSETTNVWNDPLLSVIATGWEYPAVQVKIRCESHQYLAVFVSRRPVPGDGLDYIYDRWTLLHDDWDYSIDGMQWFKGDRSVLSDDGYYSMIDTENALRFVDRILESDSDILYIQRRSRFAPPPPSRVSTADKTGIAAVKADCT